MNDQDIAGRFGASLERIELGDVSLRVAIAGDGPLVMLVHGFPESWYSWRHQIQPLVQAGFRVAAPDVRGYGGSDRPHPVEAYDIQSLTSDMFNLARFLSPDKPAVIVGHDWGGPIAWNSALIHPQQFRAVAGLSVPHVPPGDVVGIDVFRKVFTDNDLFFYMIYFQDEGVAEAELEADPIRSIRLFFSAIAGDAKEGAWPLKKPHGQKLYDGVLEPDMPRPWFNHDDLQYYAAQFAHSGFRGPLNRYRNFHRDARWLKSQQLTTIEQPSLYLIGDRDLVAPMYQGGPIKAMQPYVSDLRGAHVLEACGHWTQQEKPDEVNRYLLAWLEQL